MGMDQAVLIPGPSLPSWEAVRDLLARHGFPVQVRMIDGLPAFPDESPAATWNELRVGTPGGMVTLRREADRVVLVTWGNADAALRQAWNALAWAFAAAAKGRVQGEAGGMDEATFRARAELPDGIRAP